MRGSKACVIIVTGLCIYFSIMCTLYMAVRNNQQKIGIYAGNPAFVAHNEVEIPEITVLQRTNVTVKNVTYRGVALPQNYDQLFYRADMRPFIKDAIEGAPFQYLPDYRNPCWMSRIVPDRGNPSTRTTKKVPRHASELYDRRLAAGHNWRMRCIPLVHQVGFAKSGTTDLYNNIVQHPDILRGCKEPLFWSYARYDNVGPEYKFSRTLAEYIDEYAEAAERTRHHKKGILLDASTTKVYYMDGWKTFPGHEYSDEPEFTIPMTIRAVTPDARIIVIMRNPIDRTYSRYRWFYHIKRNFGAQSPEGFHKSVVVFLSEMSECLRHQTLRRCAYNYTHFSTVAVDDQEKHCMFIRGSLYYVYVKDWLDVFPRDQIHFVLAEEYYRDRSKSVRDIYRFLDLDPDILSPRQYEKINSSTVKLKGKEHEPMLNATRTLLREFFLPYNRMLAQLLEDERYIWEW